MSWQIPPLWLCVAFFLCGLCCFLCGLCWIPPFGKFLRKNKLEIPTKQKKWWKGVQGRFSLVFLKFMNYSWRQMKTYWEGIFCENWIEFQNNNLGFPRISNWKEATSSKNAKKIDFLIQIDELVFLFFIQCLWHFAK